MPKAKDILDTHLSHIRFDRSFIKTLDRYRLEWLNKNDDHRMFFGSNTIGVYTIRFTMTDIVNFFEDILNVDMIELRNDVLTDKDINPDWKVSSDIFNITLTYIIHKFLTNTKLPQQDRTDGAKLAAMIFNYRALAVIHSNYFKYPLDPRVSTAVITALSNRYAIKKLGTWEKVIEDRSLNTVIKASNIYTKLIRFTTPDMIYSINDMQGRIRSMMKNIMDVASRVKESNLRIDSVSSVMTDADGEEVVRDITDTPLHMVDYIISIIPDEHALIKQELITITLRLVNTVKKKHLLQTLKYLSDNIIEPSINNLVKDMMEYSIQYLNDKNTHISGLKDIDKIMITLRGLWLNARTNDPNLDRLRNEGDKLVKDAIHRSTKSTLASTRTAVYLYLFLRAITKKHYGG